jgi:hypothetical protein
MDDFVRIQEGMQARELNRLVLQFSETLFKCFFVNSVMVCLYHLLTF